MAETALVLHALLQEFGIRQLSLEWPPELLPQIRTFLRHDHLDETPLEDQLHAREINLHILTGICAGLHRPTGATIADKMLFLVAAMAAEMERELIRERTLDGLAAAHAQGRRGGRPPALDPDTLAVALARRARGESVTAIAAHLGIGRSTLYRALDEQQ